MYKTNSKRQCLICQKDLDKETSLAYYLYHPCLCQKCIQSFKVIDIKGKLKGYPLHVLYDYNDFFRKILYQYKALDDYVLKDAFLTLFPEMKEKYDHYMIIIIPSREIDNSRRGFCPNEEIVKTFSQNIFTGLYKSKDYKQTSQKDRTQIKKILKIKDGDFLTKKKVLIFDDVMTSSNTLQAALNLVERYSPASIELLVLSSSHWKSFTEDID